MYQYPVLFPAMSNRESFSQVVQIADDQTGDLIALADGGGSPYYQIYLEIRAPRRGDRYFGNIASPYYDYSGEPIIMATLSNYLSIVDTGTIQVQIPFTVMQTLHGDKTYDVFMRIEDVANSDARQILIGKLPVAFGGDGT